MCGRRSERVLPPPPQDNSDRRPPAPRGGVSQRSGSLQRRNWAKFGKGRLTSRSCRHACAVTILVGPTASAAHACGTARWSLGGSSWHPMSDPRASSSSRLRRSPHEAVPCPNCGYNLKGVPDIRCPECGHAFSLDWIYSSDYCSPNARRWVARSRSIAAFVLIGGAIVFVLLSPGCVSFFGLTLLVAILGALYYHSVAHEHQYRKFASLRSPAFGLPEEAQRSFARRRDEPT